MITQVRVLKRRAARLLQTFASRAKCGHKPAARGAPIGSALFLG